MTTTTATLRPAAAAEPWQTSSYCSACHRNHPGSCGCACHLPQGAVTDYWMAALKLYGCGRTAAAQRAEAGDPAWVAGLAYIDGVTPEQERAEMLWTARAIEELAAAGLTPEQAYFLASLDRDLGPYADNADLARVPEAAA